LTFVIVQQGIFEFVHQCAVHPRPSKTWLEMPSKKRWQKFYRQFIMPRPAQLWLAVAPCFQPFAIVKN